MKRIIRFNDQTVADVCVQQYGTMEVIGNLCVANDVQITDTTKDVMFIEDEKVNKRVVEMLNKKENRPATGLVDPIADGIGFWRAGIDYII
ncbi:MAG: hypothetical protein IPH58_05615 [Sphingobacteriales bacterium]|jgi:hypothetical protein|nr:hypothetical protein [Sphingobacteriales bacterium]